MNALERLLRPRSIAAIGGGWAEAVAEQCVRIGFGGPVWRVHPSGVSAHAPCVRDVTDLPDAPDAVFVGVNRDLTPPVVNALRDMGAGGAVCFASGFREAGGAEQEQALIAAAGDMPVLGPNCYGLINYLDGAALWPDQHGGKRVERGVAIISQSSNILINMTMQRRGLPLAYALTVGNQAWIGLADLAMAVMEDPRVTAIGLYVEGVDPRGFEAMAAMSRARGVPIIAMKAGRSEAARAAAVSHTASLAGGHAASEAFFDRIGIPRLPDAPSFIEALKLLHVHGPLPGRRVASLSCSGGEASLMADIGEGIVDFPPLTDATKQGLAAALGPRVELANPLDYHTYIWADAPKMRATYAAMARGTADLVTLVYDYPRTDRCSDEAWSPGERAFVEAMEETCARGAVVASLPENLPEAKAEMFMAAGVAPMLGMAETLMAVRACSAVGLDGEGAPPSLTLPPMGGGDASGAVLDEVAAKALLKQHGLHVPEGAIASTPAMARRIAEQLGPVAVKLTGAAHKTEHGGVALNCAPKEAEAAAARMGGPVLVEAMAPRGVELLIGVTRDPVFGFLLTLGAGGVLTEVMGDAAHLLVPATARDVHAALLSLRIAPMLSGYRGAPAVDMDALTGLIMTVQDIVTAEAPRLEELELNPVIAHPGGAVAVDALMRVRKEAHV